MAATMDRMHARAPGRWQAFLLAAALPLFLGALWSDYAYSTSYELQWSNFASWLVAGGMVFLGIALVFAIVDLVRGRRVAACISCCCWRASCWASSMRWCTRAMRMR